MKLCNRKYEYSVGTKKARQFLVKAAAGAAFTAYCVLNVANAQPFPAVFSLGSLDGTNGFRLDGSKAHGQAGFAASSASDVNGDGIADLIVGAPAINKFAGSVYVMYGKSAGFVSPYQLDALASPNFVEGFRVDGAANSALGHAVGTAGDLNADGIDDFIVGAAYADPNGVGNAGSTYVVFGRNCSLPFCIFPTNWDALTGSTGLRMDGSSANDWSGFDVRGVGDVNDDGVDDIIIGANHAEPGGMPFAGSTYLVYGRGSNDFTSPNMLANLGVTGFGGYRLDGLSQNAESGYSVSGAGDINGDGIKDFIIGAPTENLGQGVAYVVFGKRMMSGTGVRLISNLNGSNGFRLLGSPTERAGSSVSAAGDVNGDGFDDIIVGAMFASPNGQFTAGSSYVVFGHSGSFSPSITLSTLNGTNGFRIDGIGAGDTTGEKVSSAGDVNGDGFADVIIGAQYANYGFFSSGSAYVVFGHGGSFAPSFSLSALNGLNGFAINGEAEDDYLGSSVGSGDFNADGFDDLIIGARYADSNGNVNAGSAYVIFGHQ